MNPGRCIASQMIVDTFQIYVKREIERERARAENRLKQLCDATLSIRCNVYVREARDGVEKVCIDDWHIDWRCHNNKLSPKYFRPIERHDMAFFPFYTEESLPHRHYHSKDTYNRLSWDIIIYRSFFSLFHFVDIFSYYGSYAPRWQQTATHMLRPSSIHTYTQHRMLRKLKKNFSKAKTKKKVVVFLLEFVKALNSSVERFCCCSKWTFHRNMHHLTLCVCVLQSIPNNNNNNIIRHNYRFTSFLPDFHRIMISWDVVRLCEGRLE